MKQWIAGSALAVCAAIAVADDSGPGCGVGSIIFKNQSGVAPHVLAATTNGIYGNQTFGMSTGTLGCNPEQPVTSTAAYFIEDNVDQIALDISRGEGEYLNALAVIMEISPQDRDHFKQVLQSRFDHIFSGQSRSSDVIEGIANAMKDDARLASYLI